MSRSTQSAFSDEYIYLMGRPRLGDFIRFARRPEPDEPTDEVALSQEWIAAREIVRQLETEERGAADEPGLQALPHDMKAAADREAQMPAAQRALRYVPYSWRLVEIDKLVVYQKGINLRVVREIQEGVSASPSNEELINLAVGRAADPPPVHVTRAADSGFLFSSTSYDLRFLDVTAIDPAGIQGYEPSGYARRAVVVYVGFGPNMLSATQFDKRIVLTNGTHRAYALRALGIKYVPCLITHITNEGEFELVAPPEIKENREYYLRSPRPPMFKDYFDPRLHKKMLSPRVNQMLQLQFSMQKNAVPAT